MTSNGGGLARIDGYIAFLFLMLRELLRRRSLTDIGRFELKWFAIAAIRNGQP